MFSVVWHEETIPREEVLNSRLVHCLDKEGALHEGQAGFRVNRSCMDNVYTLNIIVQGRLKEDKETYAFFDVQKAYDTVWRDGLWLKLWDMGVKGKMWRVIKKMHEAFRSPPPDSQVRTETEVD